MVLGPSSIVRIDPDTGASALIANIAPIRSGITFSPDGVMYGMTVFDGVLYTIDPSDGSITLIGGSGPQPNLVEDASFTPEGRMFFTDFGGTLYEIDPAGGTRNVVGTTGMGNGLVGLINTDPIVSCDPCDMNCDGMVNAFDIEPFLCILFQGCRPCDTCTGDVNGDGNRDAFDIEPFLECLFP